jgi:hypothetical protein
MDAPLFLEKVNVVDPPWARANRAQAARLLRISRRQLFDTIRQYGLHEPGNEPEA